jgi:hypothetical protein
MDAVDLIPDLVFLGFPFGPAALWHADGGLTLTDTSGPGGARVVGVPVGQHQAAQVC